jgi:pyruvate/2-oxoglutarate dehydrogenase complex dihydrolipoamide acyltransferase (E2) component
MNRNVTMFALSPVVQEAVIVKWIKQEGDAVVLGDTLCQVKTDKFIKNYASSLEGILLLIIATEGQSVVAGDTIAIISEQGETQQRPYKQNVYVSEGMPQKHTW